MILSPFSEYIRAAFAPSTESMIAADQVEREYVFYGKMEDSADLQEATHYEDQEQWRVLLPSKDPLRQTSVRVRRTVAMVKLEGPTAARSGNLYEAKDPVYTVTVKSFVKGQPGNLESEVVMSPESGEALLKILRAEGDGMIKRRYFFQPGYGYFPPRNEKVGVRMRFEEGTQWEVDVFFVDPPAWKDGRDDDGTYFAPYVKLDFEVKRWDLKVKEDGFGVPFPIKLSDVVYGQPHNRSAEDEARVKKIMDLYMKAK